MAEGDLNEFAGYLGSFPSPIIRDNVYSRLPGDLPNRFLAWGQVPLPLGFRIAPILELRDGFPYATYDAAQDYAGDPYVHRYPRFFSLDSRFSKDIKVNPKYTVRLSVSRLQPQQPLQPRSLPRQHRRPGLRPLLRPPRPPLHRRFRRAVLSLPAAVAP